MRHRQAGVAVVLAMGVIAVATIAATAIVISQDTWLRRIELGADRAQAQAGVGAGVDWVRAVLADDRRTTQVDHLGEPWALRLPPVSIENGEIEGYIEDQQGKFNLNNLVTNGQIVVAQLMYFQRLLSILGLPDSLADSLADWMDADRDPQPLFGAEDAYYLSLHPPRLAANQPLTDIAELALVAGFDERARARLMPYVSALPKPTALNVNTASAEVLAAVLNGIDLDGARTLAAQRDRVYFRDRADFVNRLPAKVTVADEAVGVTSDYFVAALRTSVGSAEARGVVLLHHGGAGWPTVVWGKYI